MDNEIVLQADNLTKTYGTGPQLVTALNDVSIRASRKECVGIRGPSGCGKSTLLNILGLCDEPNSGRLSIAGKSVDFTVSNTILRFRRHHLGYVFQYFNLLPTLSALENVMTTALLAGLGVAESTEQAEEVLGKLGLAERKHHLPHQLSGGQMQRVAIARAVVHRPDVILADEPTGNLDSHSGAEVIKLLQAASAAGAAVLIASHSEDVLAACQRVYSLRDGQLQTC